MAEIVVGRRTTVYEHCTVEADTVEEAILAAEERGFGTKSEETVYDTLVLTDAPLAPVISLAERRKKDAA